MAVTGSKVIFEDFTDKVTNQIKDIMVKWLHEASLELVSQTQMRAGSGNYYREVADKWTNVVDEKKLEAYVGNPLENAIWVEFGTGEYAINGDGRKPYWVFVKDSTGKSSKSSKTYTLEEAKRTVAFMRSKGLDAMYSKGTPAKRPLHNAFNANEEMLKNHLKDQLRGMK